MTLSIWKGFGAVGWGHFNSICSDVNWNDHLCTYIPFILTVVDKRGNAVNVNASRVLDKVRKQCADYFETLGDDPVLEDVGDATRDLPG